jgi:hypothetical protein
MHHSPNAEQCCYTAWSYPDLVFAHPRCIQRIVSPVCHSWISPNEALPTLYGRTIHAGAAGTPQRNARISAPVWSFRRTSRKCGNCSICCPRRPMMPVRLTLGKSRPSAPAKPILLQCTVTATKLGPQMTKETLLGVATHLQKNRRHIS